MRTTLLALALSNFAIGTGAFVVPGLLGPLTESLHLSVVVGGQLLTVYAVSYAIGSPLLVSLTSHVPRRRVLMTGICVFAAATLLSAISTNVWMLFITRIVAACGAAVFTPTASTVAVMTAAPAQRGKALATVFMGLSLSQVLGIPAGTMIAYAFGWRITFAAVALLALIAAAVLARVVPAGLEGQRIDLKSWARVLRDRRIALALAVTLLQFTGQFIPYSFIGPWLAGTLGLSAGGITSLLWLYGLSSTIGGLIGGWSADRFGVTPTLLVVLIFLSLGIFGISLATGSMVGSVAALMIWGIAGFAYNAPQQSRLVVLAPEALGVVLSLNAAALYVGTAAGGAIGGMVITHFGITQLGAAGGLFAVVAILAFVASLMPRRGTHPV